MKPFLEKIRLDYPDIQFVEDSSFSWSPKTKQVFYSQSSNNRDAKYSIIHELSHALLNHTQYSTDYELLQLETEAWEHAKLIAKKYKIEISDNHIQDCLDSYRDWLYRRSICPTCGTKSVQYDNRNIYGCFNCHTTWNVTSARFCRPYRNYKENEKSSVTFTVTDDPLINS